MAVCIYMLVEKLVLKRMVERMVVVVVAVVAVSKTFIRAVQSGRRGVKIAVTLRVGGRAPHRRQLTLFLLSLLSKISDDDDDDDEEEDKVGIRKENRKE